MKKLYAEVTPHKVNVFTTKSKRNIVSCDLPLDENTLYKGKTGVLVANVRQTSIRVVDIDKKPAQGELGLFLQRIRKSEPLSRWDLVKLAFPIGEKMNENTHIFDGAVFTNTNGAMCFFIMALPISIADEIADTGLALFGSPYKLQCLDTVEHILFRCYAKQGADALLVVFPQDGGLRVLFLTDGLPRAAWHVSNNPQFREEEILRCLRASAENEETALKRAVALNTDMDLQWLYTFLKGQGVEVEKENYCLRDFVK